MFLRTASPWACPPELSGRSSFHALDGAEGGRTKLQKSLAMWQHLKEIGKNSAIYGLGNIANSVLGFLLVPFYTHHFSTAEFGTYSLLITVFSLLSLVIDAGLTNSVGRYYFDDPPEATPAEQELRRSRLVSTALLLGAIIALLVAGATVIGASLGARILFPGQAEAEQLQQATNLRILGAALFFRGLTVAPQVYLRVTERPAAYSILTSAQLAMFLLLNIVLLTATGLGVAGVFYSLLLSTMLYAVGLIWAIRRDLVWCMAKALTRELFRFDEHCGATFANQSSASHPSAGRIVLQVERRIDNSEVPSPIDLRVVAVVGRWQQLGQVGGNPP